ncbi:MAG: FadR/GntR family transcriptional regulator [Peptococcaceae bacterium]|jgi:GntR family transcriptional repressor for pyruvate dehydrogenase complex|nr:FadR family transcriptional regulator [Peptococcaceae bacterium]MDH7526388.1 FadR/GntR family transcriptional regulator [Peptococcaceae bacterium]
MAGGKFHKLTRENFSDQIISQIKGMIEAGELNPGDKLPSERELSLHLGVSRLPIREALKTLQFINVIETRQGEGYIVKGLDRAKLLDLIDEISELEGIMDDYKEVRLILEVKAAELASLRRTEKDLQRMAEALEEMEREIKEKQAEAIKGSIDFHNAVIRGSHNRLILSIYYFYNEIVQEGRLRTKTVPGKYEKSLEVHRIIYQAIKDRDAVKAAGVMRKHIEETFV